MKVYNEQSDKAMSEELYKILDKYRKERQFNASKYIQNKSTLLNKYLSKYRIKSCVVGISGGIDSAVALALVHHASKLKDSPIKRVVPALIPIYAEGTTHQEEAVDKGKELVKTLGLSPYIIDLTKAFYELKNAVDTGLGIKGEAWAAGQLVSYIRTPSLYYTTSLLSQSETPGVVIGTTNRDEGAYLGFFGKASDAMVDVQLISDIHKSEVYKIAHKLNVPNSIIHATPSGDMYDGRPDEEVFGATYDFVELYLYYLTLTEENRTQIVNALSEQAQEQFKSLSKRVEHLHSYNSHKYITSSQSIHLDIYPKGVEGGWKDERIEI